MKYPDSKTARQHVIEELIVNKEISSQNELLNMLKSKGFDITQTTLSRDLDEINAVKTLKIDGKNVYTIKKNSADKLQSSKDVRNKLEKSLSEFVISVDSSANLAIIHTPAGAAQYVASLIDQAAMEKVLATIAGDNTVLVVTKGLDDGKKVASQIWDYAKQ
ncbi:MAG: arginine repressor [Actinomycetes bacterium]